jgi:hypothetical protein
LWERKTAHVSAPFHIKALAENMNIVGLWVVTVGQSAKWLPHIGDGMPSHNSEKIKKKFLRKQGLNVDYMQKIKIVFER